MNPIKALCLSEKSRNPYEILYKLMRMEGIPMHGPIHHFLDGAAFMTAMHNAGVDFDLETKLDDLSERSSMMPGATCGKWGMCGSASSVGAALAIIHETGPLSENEFYKDNLRLVSAVLEKIGELGGPRCCKRNGFTAIETAVEFVKEHYGIELESSNFLCDFSKMNQQCIGRKCPFHGDE